MLTYKVTPKTHGATLLARLDNKGSWKKVQSFGSTERAKHQLAILQMMRKPNAHELLEIYLKMNPQVKLKGEPIEIIKIMLEEDSKIQKQLYPEVEVNPYSKMTEEEFFAAPVPAF